MQGLTRQLFAALALCTLTATASAEPIAEDARIGMALSAQFGGSQTSSYRIDLGSTLGLSDELRAGMEGVQLPLSGVSYSSASGLNPMILGLALQARPPLLRSDEDDSSWPFGWVAAGSALIVGAVIVAASGGKDGGSNSGDNPEGGGGVLCTDGECVIPCNSTGPLLTCNTD